MRRRRAVQTQLEDTMFELTSPARRNRFVWSTLLGLTPVLGSAGYAQDQSQSLPDSIAWQAGPGAAQLGSVAEIQVPAGYSFANGDDTRRLMEWMENPVNGKELGLVRPESFDWFVTFEFDDVGYVKDDDAKDLDADALLESLRQGSEEGNKERKARGWTTLDLVGWEYPPRYDSQSNNLVWACRYVSEGRPVVNYNTRRLGRSGVMHISLVVNPDKLESSVPEFEKIMAGYGFTSGNRYSEFRVGDKVARYGLAALITGGAAAVAVKSGLFKWLWKAIVGGVIVVGAAFKKFFGRAKTA
jgi:uncharacterized membrane-anchored protein